MSYYDQRLHQQALIKALRMLASLKNIDAVSFEQQKVDDLPGRITYELVVQVFQPTSLRTNSRNKKKYLPRC